MVAKDTANFLLPPLILSFEIQFSSFLYLKQFFKSFCLHERFLPKILSLLYTIVIANAITNDEKMNLNENNSRINDGINSDR